MDIYAVNIFDDLREARALARIASPAPTVGTRKEDAAPLDTQPYNSLQGVWLCTHMRTDVREDSVIH